jgi:hypothetical protein
VELERLPEPSRTVVHQLMDELVERSTSSVVDLGSHARGDAGLDILVGP